MATAVAGVDMPLVVPCNQGTCGERLSFVGRRVIVATRQRAGRRKVSGFENGQYVVAKTKFRIKATNVPLESGCSVGKLEHGPG